MREGRRGEGGGGDGNKEERIPFLILSIIVVYIDILLLISWRITGRKEGRKDCHHYYYWTDGRKEGSKEGSLSLILLSIFKLLLVLPLILLGRRKEVSLSLLSLLLERRQERRKEGGKQ